MNIYRDSTIFTITSSLMCAIIIGLLSKDFSIVAKSSHHVSERHITLKKEIIESKTSLKFSKYFLMLLIFRCKTESWSDQLSRKLWNSPGIKYGVSRPWNFLLKKLRSRWQESSKRISLLSDILYFKVSKFLVSLSYFYLVQYSYSF